jgi:hypothetical protein
MGINEKLIKFPQIKEGDKDITILPSYISTLAYSYSKNHFYINCISNIPTNILPL